MSTEDWNAAADYVERRGDEYYGTDIFPFLPPEFDWALLDRWLLDTFGFRIDLLSAEYYRRVHTSVAAALRDQAAELREEDADVAK